MIIQGPQVAVMDTGQPALVEVAGWGGGGQEFFMSI